MERIFKIFSLAIPICATWKCEKKKNRHIPTLSIISKGEKNQLVGYCRRIIPRFQSPYMLIISIKSRRWRAPVKFGTKKFPLFTPVYTSKVGDEPHLFHQYQRLIEPFKSFKKNLHQRRFFVVRMMLTKKIHEFIPQEAGES